jgi:hypothetical protein
MIEESSREPVSLSPTSNWILIACKLIKCFSEDLEGQEKENAGSKIVAGKHGNWPRQKNH